MPDEHSFEWLRRAMEEHGWNQCQLSDASGVRRDQLSRILNGKRLPSAADMHGLAIALNLTKTQLAGLPVSAPTESRLSRKLRAVQHELNLLRSEHRHQAHLSDTLVRIVGEAHGRIGALEARVKIAEAERDAAIATMKDDV